MADQTPGQQYPLERLFSLGIPDLSNVPVEFSELDTIDIEKYSADLLLVLGLLDSEGPLDDANTHDLKYKFSRIWPEISLDLDPAKETSKFVGLHISRQDAPYASGFGNVLELMLRPIDYGRRMCVYYFGAGYSYPISDGPIIALKKIIVEEGIKSDPIDALRMYLNKVEAMINKMVAIEDNRLSVHNIAYAVTVAFSLVGSGDALSRLAGREKTRSGEYRELAERAYKMSGLEGTTYVANRLYKLGSIPPSTYVLVPLKEYHELRERK